MKDLCYEGTIQAVLCALQYPFQLSKEEKYHLLSIYITEQIEAIYILDLIESTYFLSPKKSISLYQREEETVELYLRPFENCLRIIGLNKTYTT